MISLSYAPNVVFIKSKFTDKDRIAAVPGTTWHKGRKTWYAMFTPAVAQGLLNAFYKDLDEDNIRVLMSMSKRLDIGKQILDLEDIDLEKFRGRFPLWTKQTNPWLHQRKAFLLAQALLGLRSDNPESPGGGTMLALDMGTGKSAIAVNLVVHHPKSLRRILIVCPHSVMDVWPLQFNTHTENTKPLVHIANQKVMNNKLVKVLGAMDLAEAQHRQCVIVVNYESVWRPDFARLVYENDFHLIIGDEIHRIKSSHGKASDFFAKAAMVCTRHLGLTGTPLPHSPMDAFGSFRFLDPGVFGTSYSRFRNKYAVMGGYDTKQIVAYQNEEEFNKRFYSISYRVLSDEVQDLPERIDVCRYAELEGEEERIYTEIDKNFCVEVESGVITVSNALVKLLRLQEITGGFLEGLPIGVTKRKLLSDTLEDFHPDEPLVIMAWFTRDLQTIEEVVKEHGRSYSELSGNRHELKDWQEGKANTIGVQIRSGKEGVDFTRARYCIYYSKNFSLGDLQQSKKRIHRPGQTLDCTYIHLLLKKTVDVRIMKALERREDIIESILKQIEEKEVIDI